MSGAAIIILLGSLIAIYGLYRLGLYLWENYYLSPKERWRRRYDQRMKRYFRSI